MGPARRFDRLDAVQKYKIAVTRASSQVQVAAVCPDLGKSNRQSFERMSHEHVSSSKKKKIERKMNAAYHFQTYEREQQVACLADNVQSW